MSFDERRGRPAVWDDTPDEAEAAPEPVEAVEAVDAPEPVAEEKPKPKRKSRAKKPKEAEIAAEDGSENAA